MRLSGASLLVSLRTVCRRVPPEAGLRSPALFPFHCWSTPQSHGMCTFINFNVRKKPRTGPFTRFTVGLEEEPCWEEATYPPWYMPGTHHPGICLLPASRRGTPRCAARSSGPVCTVCTPSGLPEVHLLLVVLRWLGWSPRGVPKVPFCMFYVRKVPPMGLYRGYSPVSLFGKEKRLQGPEPPFYTLRENGRDTQL